MIALRFILLLLIPPPLFTTAQEVEALLFHPYELRFEGSVYEATDNPVRDILLTTTWRHESGSPSYTVFGFYDGDGEGGAAGNVFKVRFCPTETGRWTLEETVSNDDELDGQHEGTVINCTSSDHKGFWRVDDRSNGRRWFRRSDGSHAYILGNTMYTFLSGMRDTGPNGSTIAKDVAANAGYFNKLRFGINGGRYPHPEDKPFLDHEGNPTDDGHFSHRPNPKWFRGRVDVAVKTAFENDIIADIILNGPDANRALLIAGENGGDNTPYLRYMAARYGSFPNVWFCLTNEWNLYEIRYTPDQIRTYGHRFRPMLPYDNPLSVHSSQRDWDLRMNSDVDWNSHVILQYKIKKMHHIADLFKRNYYAGGADKPQINDELGYEGDGDGWSEGDVIEGQLGAFLGGGYGTTGYKYGSKLGHYFWGAFSADEHTAADNLRWFRQIIDEHIAFWKMSPIGMKYTCGENPCFFGGITNVHEQFRAMGSGDEVVLGTNRAWENIRFSKPAGGRWRLVAYDLIGMSETVVAESFQDEIVFDAPDSRAVLFHFKKIDQ